jgi:hypothetical protein
MSTGNVELDICARIAELLPAVWRSAATPTQRQNVWDGKEVAAGGDVAEDALFVELITTRHELYEDTQVRYFDFEVLRRFSSKAAAAARRAARAESMALYDALHLSGGFVGAATDGEYLDIRAIDSPVFLGDRHYALNVTAWRIG